MKITVIIRTFNESKWIAYCLKALRAQVYSGVFRVIVVDSGSTDNTLNIVKTIDPGVKIVIPEDRIYFPGKFINYGIDASDSDTEYVIILSAHCVPTDVNWLSNMVASIEADKEIVGVYCKQIPIRSTNYENRRDLINVFGEESFIKTKDPFFHNAASIVRRSALQKIPFDSTVKHIEDRIWAEKILNLGYKIKYEAGCSVTHEHGINQHSNDYNSLRGKGVALLQTSSDRLNDVELFLKSITNILLVPINSKAEVIDAVLKLLSDFNIETNNLNFDDSNLSLKQLITKHLKYSMVKNSSYYDYVLYINCAKYNHSEKLKDLANIIISKNSDMCFYVEEVKNDYYIFDSNDDKLIFRSEDIMGKYVEKEHMKVAQYELGTFLRSNFLINSEPLGETIVFKTNEAFN